MSEANICFPNQIFEENPCLMKKNKVYLVEDSLFFGDAKYPALFHAKKLTLHRASMKYYQEFLINKGYNVQYLDYQKEFGKNEKFNSIDFLFKKLLEDEIQTINITDPVDWALERRIKKNANKSKIDLKTYPSPGFLCDKDYISNYFNKKKSYYQTSFYIEQRKRLNILLNEDGKPLGGSWTFDKENRKKLPKDITIPKIPVGIENKHVKEAKKYVSENFTDAIGNTNDFFYPVTHKDSKDWLNLFFKDRLAEFGPYEDAMSKSEHFIFHSGLSPLLNIGLLTPKYVVEETLKYSKKKSIPLNSLEGFLRQIIGWREFMRAVYIREGVRQRNSNFWKNSNSLPASFYEGNTGIQPIDNVIKYLTETAYLNHIERLMLLGNFMNLCEVKPDEVYKWFMEFFIDAYDWVMVPNVYGMSFNADGGLITTKPYISSSNYVKKMSNYPKGDWCDIWDGLYWNFINKHKEKIKKNPRMSIMVKILNKMDEKKLSNHLKNARAFLKKMHRT